jgi:hypothetical protein
MQAHGAARQRVARENHHYYVETPTCTVWLNFATSSRARHPLCIKRRNVASRFLSPPDVGIVEDDADQQRQQQHAKWHNKAHDDSAPVRRFSLHLERFSG